MPRIVAWSLIVLVAGGLTACDDENKACLEEHEGDFTFYFDPQLPSGPDSTANIQRTITDAALVQIQHFVASVPPVIIYTFDVPNSSVNRAMTVYDLGRTLPLVEDSTYTITVDMTQRLNPPSMAIKIFDGAGLLFLGVNDWRPAGDPGAQVFESGYGELGDSGELEVFFVNDGCDPRVENTDCFQQIRNYRMDFRVGNGNPLSLRNGETGSTGNWIFHVHKSQYVIAKACGLLDQNGVSFVAEREGAR
jgi:hypothetical protein